MSSQRYERVRRIVASSPPAFPYVNASSRHRHTDSLVSQVSAHDEDDSPITPHAPHANSGIPSSPPPSFRSRASSPTSRRITDHDPLISDADRTLADTFDSPSDDENSDDEKDDGDDRQRLMRAGSGDRSANNAEGTAPAPRPLQRRVTELPRFVPDAQAQAQTARVYGGGSMANDGVFANLSAKPTRGSAEEGDEKPPVSLAYIYTTRLEYANCIAIDI